MSPIDHLDLVVTSLERSLAFYRGLLPAGRALQPLYAARRVA